MSEGNPSGNVVRRLLSPRVVLAVVAAAVVLTPGLVIWNADRSARDLLARTERRVEAERMQPRQAENDLPTVYEPSLHANSWNYLESVVEAYDLYRGPRWDREAARRLSVEERTRKFDELLASCTALLEQLRQALACRVRNPPQPTEAASHGLEWCGRFLVDCANQCRELNRDRLAMEFALLAIGMVREGDPSDLPKGSNSPSLVESFGWDVIRDVLKGHHFTREDLAWMCGTLDRLQARRPPFAAKVRARCSEARETVLGAYGAGRYWPSGLTERARHAFSPRVMYASAIASVDSSESDLLEAFSDGPHVRDEVRFKAAQERQPDHPVLSFSATWILETEAKTLRAIAMARLASAIAWYAAENGRFPASLDDLAPRYVSSIPVDASQGTRFQYGIRGTQAYLAAPASPLLPPEFWAIESASGSTERPK